ncbi:unnamed protein product [Sphagnum tenellum]
MHMEQQAFTVGVKEASGVSAQGYDHCRELGLKTMLGNHREGSVKVGGSGDRDAGDTSKAGELEEHLGYSEQGYEDEQGANNVIAQDEAKQPLEGFEYSDPSVYEGSEKPRVQLADFYGQSKSFTPAMDETKKEFKVSAFLIDQLRKLAAKERELEARLGRERVEHVVEKVEEEVEYEGVMEEMWLSMRANEESREMEQRERDFEAERHKLQLEDEVQMLHGRVWRLEEELKLAHAEKEYALQKKQDEMDGIIQGMLAKLQAEEREELSSMRGEKLRKSGDLLVDAVKCRQAAVSPSEAIFLAFEDMLKEADHRAERDHQEVESSLRSKEDVENMLQQQQRMWHERQSHLESQILALDKELSMMSATVAEAESGLVIEQERCKKAQLEVDGLLETCREEKKMRSESEEKLKRLVKFLVKMRENLMKEPADDLQGKLRTLFQELEKELQRANSKRSNEKRSQLSQSEESSQLKSQGGLVETERDKLEAKLKLQLKRAWDREREIEAMWSEREKDLVARCSHLEASLDQWEAKYKTREAEIMQERLRNQEMEMYHREWADEKAGWEAMVLQREDWLEEQVAKWTSLMDAKDHDLLKLRISYQELNHAATATKERLNELEQQVYENRRALSEHSTQTSFLCGRSPEESEGDNCLSIVKFVNETDMEEESTKMETEKLKFVRNELEMKAQDAFNLIKALQSEFSVKEKEMESDRKNLEVALELKVADAEQLKGQLSAREHEMEVLMQKFQDEVLNIDREVERERKEREEVMEMHFVAKRRLVNDMREKEERWQNEMDAITQELSDQRASVRQKDEDIAALREKLQTLEEHIKTEDLNVAKLLASFRQENDALTDELDQQRKAGELANADIWKLQQEIGILLEELDGQRRKLGPNTNQGNLNDQRDSLPHPAVRQFAGVDRQFLDTTCVIEELHKEVGSKKSQLMMIRTEQEADLGRRATLPQELNMQEEHWQQEWERKEQELLLDKENVLKQLEAEREEVSVLQGAVRELQWLLMHSEVENKDKLVDLQKKEGMVKVHSSHLQELDHYIVDLKAKLEESETKRKDTEVALAVQDLKRAVSLDAALFQPPNKQDGRNLGSFLSLDNKYDGHCIRTRASFDAGDRSGRFSVPGVQDQCWELEHPGSLGSGSGNWLAQQDETWMQRDPDRTGLPVTSPGRRQQKWLVDATWLDHVRKEQAFLRQQLEVERQRVSALAQVEAENRCIEAAVVQAVEQKQESEAKVLGLQQEVSRLQRIVAAKSGLCSRASP